MGIEFKLKDFFYPLSIIKMGLFLNKSQWYSSAKLKKYQEKRLAQIVNHAYENVPYYTDLFDSLNLKPSDFKSIGDLQKLPLLTKKLLRENFDKLTARNVKKYHPVLYKTSGSTGEQVEFYLDKTANVLEFCYYLRHWSWGGYRLGRRFAELTSDRFLRRENMDKTCHFSLLTNRLQINSMMISENNVYKIAGCLRKYKPLFLNGLASSLYVLALLFRKNGVSDISFKAVFSQGETLSADYRKEIEDVFSCKTYDSYGHMERTVAICECPQGGYHLNSEYGLAEFIEKEYTKKYFTAKIVGTSLHNFAMPLIRYEVNDRVKVSVSEVKCRCGRSLPLIEKINGRKEDVVITPDERIITDLFTVFEQIEGIEMGQIVQTKKDKIVLKIAKGKGYTDSEEKKLISILRKIVGNDMSIKIEKLSVETLKKECPGKFRVIVSDIKFQV